MLSAGRGNSAALAATQEIAAIVSSEFANKKGGPKAALAHRRDFHFVHDASGDSTIIVSQAGISSDARPQSATCLTQAIAEAFVARPGR
jgi:hypothetical protein